MKTEQTVLETIGLCRDFGGRVALDEISLTAERGEILALLGPNGVGKSTLMKLIAGMLMPSRGEARVWNRPCWIPSAQMNRVACVLDAASPPSSSTVQSILSLKGSATKQFDYSYARTLCDNHRIDPSRRWHTLSKGQKRWVLLASALASGAELMLLDETADGLDLESRRELYGLLRGQANDRGICVLIASHIISDLERIADQVAILVDGRIQLHSPLEQLREEVFELELRGDTPSSAILPVADVISSKRVDDRLLAVIRFRDPNCAGNSIPDEVDRRRISLEDVYLAYTQPGHAIESSHAMTV